MHAMKRSQSGTLPVAALCAGLLLGGCGSQAKTAATTAAPAIAQTPSTAPKQATPTNATTATTPAPTSTAGGTSAPSTTRTAPEPAFAQPEGQAEGVQGAAAAVRAHGYTPNDTSEYHSEQTLRVLVGTRTGSGDGYGQQAFFFIGGRYIGTDAKEPSARVKVVSQGDTEIALAYPLYRKGDPLSSPSGGQTTVRFQLNNGKLAPLGQIPPASSTAGLSRY
jgi:LppP/LprE lipoprotein